MPNRISHQTPGSYKPDRATARAISDLLLSVINPIPGPLVGGMIEKGYDAEPLTAEEILKIRKLRTAPDQIMPGSTKVSPAKRRASIAVSELK